MTIQRDRAYRWEKEVADELGGERKRAGPGVDVVARGYTIECKSRQDYEGLRLLESWLQQAEKYDEKWVLAIKLGMRKNKRRLAVMDFDEFNRITEELEILRAQLTKKG